MRLRGFVSFAVVTLLLAFSAPSLSAQAVSLTSMGSAYTQNFDTLSNTAGSTTNNLTIPGWFLTESGGGARDNEQYAVDTGGSTTGDMYSYGAAASTERALGQLRSGTLIPIWGAAFTNNTGVTITSLDVAYTGEEWRLGTAARTDQINFQYSLNATDLVTGTWVNVAALNFVTPDTVTAGAKNGNAAADRTSLSNSITGLSIPAGATFWIRWNDVDATGADDGLAVDDFSLTPQGAVANNAPTITAPANPITTVPHDAAPFTAALSGNDDGGIYNWTATAGTGVSNVAVTGGQGTNSVTYTVTLAAGYSGTATFTATLSDNVNAPATQPVNITVVASPAAPTGLAAAAGTSHVALSWNSVSGATSYNVQRSTASGSGYTTIASPGTTSYDDTTAADGTTYFYVVTAVGFGGESVLSSEVTATPMAAPTGVVATPGNAHVALAWNAVTGATGYSVLRSTTAGSGYASIATPGTNSYDDTTAVNGTQYFYVVTATNANGVSLASSEVNATPAAPGILVISQVYGGAGCGTAGCSTWKNDYIEIFNRGGSPVSVNGWSVQYAAAGGTGAWQVTALPNVSIQPGQYFLVAEGAGANGVNVIPTADATGSIAMSATAAKVALVSSTVALSGTCPTTNVVDEVGYGSTANCSETAPAPAPSTTNAIFRAAGGCTDVNNNSTDFAAALSAPRNTASPTHSCAVPPNSAPTITPPANPAATVAQDAAPFTVNVSGNDDGAIYNWSATPGTGISNVTATGGQGTATVTYTVTLVAGYNGTATFTASLTDNVNTPATQPVNITVTTAPVAPAAPAGVTATAGNGHVQLNWNSVSGATSYNVKRSTTAGSGYATINSPATNSFDDTGVSNGTTYYYVITAVGAGGESVNSSEVSATPNNVPSAPTGVIAAASNAQVGLSWNAVAGAASYTVKRGTVSGTYPTTFSGLLTTSYSDSTAVNNTTYFYVVSATNAAGEGPNSSEVSATPTAPVSHLVISQVYGGGGNAGATYKNDFIEIFNPTGATIDLTGWSVQYSGATATTWSGNTPLSGSLAPGHYYLIQEGAGAGGTVNLPTPDATGSINMSGTSAKVALVSASSTLPSGCPSGPTLVDLVGYGTGAQMCFEGTAAAPLLSNTTAALRASNGCVDTDQNANDFTAGTVNPRNTATAPHSCGQLVGSGLANPSSVGANGTTLLTVAVTPASSPASTGITVTGDLTPIGGSGTQTFYDDGSHGDLTPGDLTYSFTATIPLGTSAGAKTINAALDDAQLRSSVANIALTILAPTNPSGSGTATPSSVTAGQQSLLTVAVTAGQFPASTSIAVSADLTLIGGSASQTFYDDGSNGDVTPGDGTWSYNATTDINTTTGTKSLPVTITDAQSRTGNATISLTVQSAFAPPAPSGLTATPGNGVVGLSWSSSTGATGYFVKRGTTNGGPYPTIVASNIPGTTFNDTSVTNGTTYYYVVTATNGTESGPSNQATATPATPPPSGSLAKVYYIDIGQGASTLIVSPTGKTLLVDGGESGKGTSKVIPLLNTLGIATVDYTVLTHYHIDHDGGLGEVINAGRLSGIAYDNGDDPTLIPPNFSTSPTSTYGTYAAYVNAINSHSGTVTRMVATPGTVINLGGGMQATILAQGGKLLSGGQVAINNSDLNTESISVLIEYNNFDFLVSGDLTGGGSTDTAKTPDVETFVGQLAGDVEVMEFDHHGSTTANNRRFLSALKAEAALAEAGYTNTFGHPNRETINKYLNIPATDGHTYGGTSLPAPGQGPVAYQTDPSPAGDQRCTLQGYSGAAPAAAGNGTVLLKTDGTTSFSMESFEDGGVRLSPLQHIYAIDNSTSTGLTTNFPPTVIPSINPPVPLATDAVIVQAQVNDREDAITTVTLNYAINGTTQAPVAMTLSGGLYTATIPAQPDGTRVDYLVNALAGGATTTYNGGYFSGTTPISTLRVLDANGSPQFWDYAARVQGVITSGTGNYATGTNDDYLDDGTGAINVWRTIQPTTPAVQTTTAGTIYSVAGLIGESAGRLRLEITPRFTDTSSTPYGVTAISASSVPAPLIRTIAQLNANPESFEAKLVQVNNCTITSGTIPSSPASIDGFLTISDGTGTFQLKVDHNTDIPGMTTPSGAFTLVGILQQDDFLRPFDSSYDVAPRNRADLGGVSNSGPGLISVADARIDVDAGGNSPGDYVPDLLNQQVHVRGVVTSINFRGSNGSGIEYYIQDSTAGVDIFSTATTRSLAVGDNVDVIATVKQFNGLTEFDPGATLANLTVLAPGTLPAVTPQVVTVSQLGDNGGGEPLEGRLIRINNVTLTSPPATFANSTNYTITDGTGTGTIRISASTNIGGTAPPAGTFSIVGVLGQFDSAAPFDSGYQLFPRSTADFLPAVQTPASITATAGTPQSATVNTTFATQLAATVKDGSNAVISGASVTFTAPASGASGTFAGSGTSATVSTDASGIATAPLFTANAATGSYNVTATVDALSANFALTNLPPAATHFSVTAPANTTSGTPFNVTVTALDASNATVIGYAGTVHFTSSSAGTLPGDYTFVGGDNGSHTFSVTLTTAGSQSVTATDSANALTGSANTTVAAPAQVATHFSVTVPANVTAGVAFNATVTALDASNATVTGYTGTVHFTSSSAGTLPGDYTFVGGDNGAHTFSVTLTTTGAQSVTATDTVTASITGSGNTTVAAPPQVATHFSVTVPANVTAGVAFNATVTALDASNATVTGYTGTVHFTSSSAGTLPSDYTFVAGDNGAHTFSVTLTSTGAQSVTATDTVTASITGSANTTVGAAPPPPATHFSVTAPSNTVAGTPFNVTVTALDASNASVAGYTGTVHFTSSSAGTLPSDYTFVAGDNGAHTFSVTLTSTGAQSITATDTVTASITGSANTTVGAAPPPPATHFSVTAPANTVSGTPFNVTVTALDASNATVPGYTGTVHFTSSSAGTLPANYTFVAGDNGTHTVSVTLTTAGAQSVTATDTVTASITGSANTTVAAPPQVATHFSVVASPNSVGFLVPFNLTVTALDVSNAVVTGYTGAVHFTSSSSLAILPADYTFVAGDAGTHTFSVRIDESGTHSVTATDTVNPALTGSASVTVTCPNYIVTAGNDGPACIGGSVHLSANSNINPVSFSWAGPGGFTSSQQNPLVTVAGTYTVTIQGVSHCTASASTTVVFNNAPAVTITADSAVCALSAENTASVPSAGTGATYHWVITGGAIQSGAGTNSITYSVGAGGSVQIDVTVTATGGCNASAQVLVPITPAPTATLPTEIASCGPATVTIPVSLTGTAPWTIVWSDGVTQDGITDANTSRTFNATTSTTLGILQLFDASCSHSAAGVVHINVDNGPAITTQPTDITVAPGSAGTFTVTAAGSNQHYQWYEQNGNGIIKTVGTDSPSYTTDPVHGNMTVWVVVSNGCGSIESAHVTAMLGTPRRRGAAH
jgi:beta-lactamase superfamily II metal-dependent hydrolase/fibronectin type 3 domain-containing protein